MMAAVQQGLYPDMAACAAEWVDPLLGERPNPTRKSRRPSHAVSRSIAKRGKPCGRSGAPCRHRRGTGQCRVKLPSSATCSCCPACSRRRSAKRAGTRARHPLPRSALARRADGARLCRPGSTGSRNIWATPTRSSSFIGDAEMLVTHLAPLSDGMMERLPALKLVAVSRGGPVNIDMKAARDAASWSSTRPAAMLQRGGRIHHRRHPRRDAATSRAATMRCARANGAATSTAPTAPAANSPK